MSKSSGEHRYRYHHPASPGEQGDDGIGSIIEEEDCDDDEEGDDSMEDDDDDTVVGTCLHCGAPPPSRSSSRGVPYSGGGGGGPCSAGNSLTATSAATCTSVATRVQVSCDDCRAFICDACHWCHEFQANHEIRVCDRCDAFYCRGCDEMDQCEDCSEVVCNTCSTLMSCKFCGCGLCEDCATACGRCGIVLCARDAKFAVECDTCRMSYCLVCLASGTKDPCVRCGHRPSKRVEQLVHLRLKSIYKAFKQSGASSGSGGGNGGGGNGGGGNGGPNSVRGFNRSDGSGARNDGSGKYSSALRSLAENSSESTSSTKDNFTHFDQSMASEVAAVLQTASNSMVNSDGGGDYGDNHSRRVTGRGKRIPSVHDHSPSSLGVGGARHRSSSRASNAAERYFRKNQAEMEAAAAAAEAEAEAAAAALLAELDEEKASSGPSKKSKKKKKKKEKKKEAAEKKEAAAAAGQQQKASLGSVAAVDHVKSANKDDKNVSPPTRIKKKSSKKATALPNITSKDFAQRAEMLSNATIEDDSSDEEMNFEQLVAGAKGSTQPSKKKKKDDNSEETSKSAVPPSKPKPEPPPPLPVELTSTTSSTTADFDAELAILLSSEDEGGLEIFLANLKGIPGLGAARKTAKKALKKLKEARQPLSASPPTDPKEKTKTPSCGGGTKDSSASTIDSETTKHPKLAAPKVATQKQTSRPLFAAVATAATAVAPIPLPFSATQHEPLLRVVSRTQSNTGTIPTRVGGSSSSNSTSVPASARAECVMHMSPTVVGWVIGKGGSRIRDMMEESGAKIWIDQESMGAKEARVVYVSGKRGSVDAAVRMVKDLVAKAPVAASAAAAAQGSLVALPAPTNTASLMAKSSPTPTVAVSTSAATNPSSMEVAAAKEPASFAAAITGSGASTPVAAVTPPTPNPVCTTMKQPQTAITHGWALPVALNRNNILVAAPQASPQSIQVAVQQAPKEAVTTVVMDGGGAKLSLDTVTSEISCDPRFVALLIGCRGWTVKNIQSESGADLSIDQAVDPPKIIISGTVENVSKAERLVREILKYPHLQPHQHRQQQEVPPQQPNVNILGAIDNNNNIGVSLDHNSLGDTHNMMPALDKPVSGNSSPLPLPTSLHRDTSSSSVPLSTGSLRRDVSSSRTPNLLDELQLQQESSRHQTKTAQAAEEAMNFSSGHSQYQQQNQSNLALFHDLSSAAASKLSEFLPSNDQHQSLHPSIGVVDRAQSQDWCHHSQASMQTQYSALPPFPSDQYVPSNPNATSLARQQSTHDNIPSRRPSSSFALPPIPPDQPIHFQQNLDGVVHHAAPMLPPPIQQLPPRMDDFMGTGSSSSHSVNGWDLPANAVTMGGGTWNQSHHTSLSSSNLQQPSSFQTPFAPSPLPSNPFHHPIQTHHHPTATSSQPDSSNNRVSDDSLMVDNMFASLGTSGGEGDGGLLNALNSVSLGGVSLLQAGGPNWGKITGWVPGENTDNLFAQRSRLGDYREER